jgi:hypothetical protein
MREEGTKNVMKAHMRVANGGYRDAKVFAPMRLEVSRAHVRFSPGVASEELWIDAECGFEAKALVSPNHAVWLYAYRRRQRARNV